MGVELVWSASPLGGTSSMPSARVESGSGARSFLFRAWRISRSIIREVSARVARRSRHGNPRYRSAGIVTLEPWRLVAPWIGHTYSGASPDRSCARASRRIGTESNRRGLGRSRQSWIGVCLMAASCHVLSRGEHGAVVTAGGSAPAGLCYGPMNGVRSPLSQAAGARHAICAERGPETEAS